MLTLGDTFGNLDTEGALPKNDMAAGVKLRRTQRYFTDGAVEDISQVDQDLCVVVLAAGVEFGPVVGRTSSSHAPEQGDIFDGAIREITLRAPEFDAPPCSSIWAAASPERNV